MCNKKYMGTEFNIEFRTHFNCNTYSNVIDKQGVGIFKRVNSKEVARYSNKSHF